MVLVHGEVGERLDWEEVWFCVLRRWVRRGKRERSKVGGGWESCCVGGEV